MSNNTLDLQDVLIIKYGPLMNFSQVAEVFDRSEQGLRVSIYNNQGLGAILKPIIKKIGRRVYFSTSEISNIIDEH